MPLLMPEATIFKRGLVPAEFGPDGGIYHFCEIDRDGDI